MGLYEGENNPMYGKSVLDVWVDRYGISKANIEYEKLLTKISNSLKKFYSNNPEYRKSISNRLKNGQSTDEHKKNLRLALINYINKKLELNGDKVVPHFNIKACELFDKISKSKHIKILHALNGGEYYLEKLGYWVDGYDIENNVVYEYYEKYHIYKKERDSIREKEIIKHLNCKLVIINEGKEYKFL